MQPHTIVPRAGWEEVDQEHAETKQILELKDQQRHDRHLPDELPYGRGDEKEGGGEW